MVEINYDEIDLDVLSIAYAARDLYKDLSEGGEIKKVRHSPDNYSRIWRKDCRDPIEFDSPEDEKNREKLAAILYAIRKKTDADGFIRSKRISTKHRKNHGTDYQDKLDIVLDKGIISLEDVDEEKEGDEGDQEKYLIQNVEVDEDAYELYGSLSKSMKKRIDELTMIAARNGSIETLEAREYVDSNGMDWGDLAEADDKIYKETGIDLRIEYPISVAREALVENKELEEEIEELERKL